MSETCGEYVERMLRGTFYYSSDIRWLAGPDRNRYLALDVFMAIKDRCVYKKLSGAEDNMMANGQEIREAVTGETHSYASYWLQRPEVRNAFKQLEDAGLIIKKMRNTAPYGYGDDEQYWLSAMGGVLIQLGRTNNRIRQGCDNMLLDRQTIGGGSKGPYHRFNLDEEDTLS